ncbi:DnaJ domain-containing protein [Altererythrobacter endophyticus]|uniref:DnaJ domain-containing protein n=1 Tax=Altericroceibacterium endophyticum TaxID=1808508 RepID=A0A6I4T262_9SPHN|nr:DnaJ domain-containing protein [Altericroceibacterium endophyticum]
MRETKFHGRFESKGRSCERPGCTQAGEFRAPSDRGPGFDGPGEWRWFCLEHVREFNAGYDWFEGMSADEILDAQSPISGWRTYNRVYQGTGPDMPRWQDYDDPLDAINGRMRDIKRRAAGAQAEYNRFTPHEREALTVMGLSASSDRQQLRRRYSELVRRYHPDRNGGDRSHENRLQRVVEAYQLLRRAGAFA